MNLIYLKKEKQLTPLNGVGWDCSGLTRTIAAKKFVMPIGSEDFLCLSAHRFKCPLYCHCDAEDVDVTLESHISVPFYLRSSQTVPSDDPYTTISLSLDVNAHHDCNTSQSHVT